MVCLLGFHNNEIRAQLATGWRPFLPVRVPARTFPAIALRPSTSSSSRKATNPHRTKFSRRLTSGRATQGALLRVAPLRSRSVQRLPISPVSRQLSDRVDYHPPHGHADHIAGPPELIEMSMGAFECMRTVVLNHCDRGAPSIDVVNMKYGAMPRAAVGRPSLSD
jgi:hypothetical protein